MNPSNSHTASLGAALCALLVLASPAFATDALAKDKDPKAPPVEVERENGEPVIVHEGEASFYGGSFHGKKTASGERMDQNKPTAASRELPLGTKATVTNQENGKTVDVIVNDRGPYVDGRVIDLSKKAAKDLDMIEDGVAPVRVEMKPSEQPNEEAREKVEAKAEQADKPDGKGAARKPAGREAAPDTDKVQTGKAQAGSSGDTVTQSGSDR